MLHSAGASGARMYEWAAIFSSGNAIAGKSFIALLSTLSARLTHLPALSKNITTFVVIPVGGSDLASIRQTFRSIAAHIVLVLSAAVLVLSAAVLVLSAAVLVLDGSTLLSKAKTRHPSGCIGLFRLPQRLSSLANRTPIAILGRCVVDLRRCRIAWVWGLAKAFCARDL